MDLPEKDDDDDDEDPADEDEDEDSDGEESEEDDDDDEGHVSKAINHAKDWMKKHRNPVLGMLRRIKNNRMKDKARGLFRRLWKNKQRESEESPNP